MHIVKLIVITLVERSGPKQLLLFGPCGILTHQPETLL